MRRIRFESLENREVFSASPLATLADAPIADVAARADYCLDGTFVRTNGSGLNILPYVEQDNLYRTSNRLSLEARDQVFANLSKELTGTLSLNGSDDLRDHRNGIIAILIGL